MPFGLDQVGSASAAADQRPRETLFAALLILAWLAATAWARPLHLPDEGRYVGVAWEMLRSGDWLTPTLDGLPFFHKPPLFYWITAGSMALFGPGEFAARAAPVLGASAGALALYVFTRRWSGARMARRTLLALAVQPLFFIGGQYANLDMLVAGLIAVTIALLADAALRFERGLPFRRVVVAAYAFAALAVLAKGLIGVVLPVLVIVPWLVLGRRWRSAWALLSVAGALVFMLIAAPWFIAEQQRFPDFLYYFFIVQHFKRFAAGGFNNVQPFWFYPAVLVVFSLPMLWWLGRSIAQRAAVVVGGAAEPPLRSLMWLWAGMITLFFSMPASKPLGYILPAVPPLAFLMADGLPRPGAPSAQTRRLWWIGVAIAALIDVGAVIRFTQPHLAPSRDLALALRALRGPQDPVIMLNRYHFDLPFYARLREPVLVVTDWASPDIRLSDSWSKELADAGRFAPERAATTLLAPTALPAALCGTRTSWIIGSPASVAQFPYLAQARTVRTERDMTLWRIDLSDVAMASALACAAPPSTAPAT